MDRTDRHSRLVLWLKVTLPLVALAILSTLFFVAETLDPDAAIPYAEVDVERILRDQGMSRPSFGGVTNDGVEITLSATTVKPGVNRHTRLVGSNLNTLLKLPEQGTLSIISPEGIIDTENGLAVLQGGALLESSNGYQIETESIVTSYTQATALAEEEVRANGPLGKLTAGAMELRQRTENPSGYLLLFRNGVELIYIPQP